MTVKTQGTDLYALVPETGEIIDVGCVTTIDGLDSTVDQIETTCLNGTARTYEGGLATPGNVSFGLNTDPADSNHVRLMQLKSAGTMLRWAIGWRQEAAIVAGLPGDPPTSAADSSGEFDFVLPTTRHWLVFDGYMSGFSYSFALNAVVTSTVGIQMSGEPVLVPATAS